MSYCVNCGVKLDSTLKTCPLCHTPVMNPNEMQIPPEVSPFAEARGTVETVKKRDLAIWMSIVLTSTSLGCFILNLLVYNGSRWSYPVIDSCILLWILLLPAMFSDRISLLPGLVLDIFGIIAYQFSLSLLTVSDLWFYKLGLPITILLSLILAVVAFFYRKVSHSLLATALYFFAGVAVLCVGIELLIMRFLNQPLHISWSAIVLSVCTVISIALITILSLAGLRTTVRKRLHF